MYRGDLTEKEDSIIRQLLKMKGINVYEIVVPVGEGRELPGGAYEDEVESLSGTIVTATAAYGFWLDWIDGHYTLGDEKDNWMEVDMSQVESVRYGIPKISLLHSNVCVDEFMVL